MWVGYQFIQQDPHDSQAKLGYLVDIGLLDRENAEERATGDIPVLCLCVLSCLGYGNLNDNGLISWFHAILYYMEDKNMNAWRLKQNGEYLADDNMKSILLEENLYF